MTAPKQNYTVVESKELSNGLYKRYVVIDQATGELLDNAHGYGYKTKQKAYAAYKYKHLTPEEKRKHEEKERRIQMWCSDHPKFITLMDNLSFEIVQGHWGNIEFNTAFVKKMLLDSGYEHLPFTANELFRYWKKRQKVLYG